LRDSWAGKLQQIGRQRKEKEEKLRELGVDDPTDPMSIQAHITKRSKALMKVMTKKIKEIKDGIEKLEESSELE
jgi:hypothetical protein